MTLTLVAVPPRDVEQLRQHGEPVRLIDVRTPAEFREVHATGAENVPLDELSGSRVGELVAESALRPLYVICQGGGRSAKACGILSAAGAAQVVNVEGGTRAWAEAGLPVIRGQRTVSLERQVRIAAGSLVVLGTALGWWVHPVFFGLSAFIGAGLVFSGVTDTCGMALVLARFPWNRT